LDGGQTLGALEDQTQGRLDLPLGGSEHLGRFLARSGRLLMRNFADGGCLAVRFGPKFGGYLHLETSLVPRPGGLLLSRLANCSSLRLSVADDPLRSFGRRSHDRRHLLSQVLEPVSLWK
jgi:hypothetical protein